MIIAFLLGIVIGIIFFGGLYWTVQRLVGVKHPAVFMIVSVMVRMGALLVGFYFLADGGYQHILIALLGVLLVRFAMTFTMKKDDQSSTFSKVKKE